MPSGVGEIIAFLPRKVAAGPTTKPPRETGHLHLHLIQPAQAVRRAGGLPVMHLGSGAGQLRWVTTGKKNNWGRDASLFVAVLGQKYAMHL